MIRSRIVDNKTLAQIARAYDLGKWVVVHSAHEHLRKNGRVLGMLIAFHKISLQKGLMLSHSAGLFEAFVGGLHAEQGIGAVEEWLSSLLLPFIEVEYEACREQLRCVNLQDNGNPAPIGSVDGLNKKLSEKKIFDKVNWSETRVESGTFSVWKLTARYEGEVIGEASAPRKKEAKNSAAFSALRNLQSRNIV